MAGVDMKNKKNKNDLIKLYIISGLLVVAGLCVAIGFPPFVTFLVIIVYLVTVGKNI